MVRFAHMSWNQLRRNGVIQARQRQDVQCGGKEDTAFAQVRVGQAAATLP